MITHEQIRRFHELYRQDRNAQALTAAMAGTAMADLAFVPVNAAKLSGAFEIEVKTHGITAQQKSGRCWLFAAMNIMREEVIKKTGLTEFELSGNYLAFFDKLEKANNVLEMAITEAARPQDDRMTEYILNGFHDGGHWCMAADLVRKYGAVPKSAMPESYQSTHTETFMDKLTFLIRKDAWELREMVRRGEDPSARKEEMLSEIFRVECIAFGEPVAQFDFDYTDADGVYHANRNMTPASFYETFIGLDLGDYITVTNHPTPGKPMGCYYSFHYIGNMAEGNVRCLNLSMDEIEDLCIRQLKAGMPVWFGCDSDCYGNRRNGIWDPDSLDYEGIMGGIELYMEKGARLQSHASYSSHAMILIGVNFDENGEPNRWKIENSWGEEAGQKGYFVCSKKYFREYVYEAIIHRSLLSGSQLALLDRKPEEIPAWHYDWM